MRPKSYGTATCAQLHPFADTSDSGYGSVSYIRQVNAQDIVDVTFVLAKSRVLPVKHITIPQKQKLAAVLLVKVDKPPGTS